MLSAVLLLLGAFAAHASAQCTDTEIRLVGGSGDWEGNVQYCHKGKWGAVCDNGGWGKEEAQVVCRQLGFTSSYNSVQHRLYSYYGYQGTEEPIVDQIVCAGTEQKLVNCSAGETFGTGVCGRSEMAGVFCGLGGSCTNNAIRLANNYVSSRGRSEGRVEICKSGVWRYICSNPYWTWSTNDARVACRQLGYTSTSVSSYYYSYFGNPGSYMSAGYSYVGCSGSEGSLASCSKTSTSSCNSYYNGGARCYGSDSASCTNNDLRLYSAFDNTPANEGVLQVCKNSQWYNFCYYAMYSSCYVAKTACVQLGYKGAVGVRYNGGFYYGYFDKYDNQRYACYSSTYTSITQCFKYYYSLCNSWNDAMGLVCYTGGSGSECTNGDVRMMNGTTEDEGRVEYCYDNTWSPVCSLSSRAASLMCQKMGYTQFTWGSSINDERFGRSDKNTLFNYLYCSSSAAQLSDCTEYSKGSGCYLNAGKCSTEYGLRCYKPGECKDGAVRLADGVIEQEGRPEVCINGVWSTFCQWGWNSIDSFVFCNMLGYDGPNPTIYYSSYFGSGNGPTAYSYVYCQGWEQDIHDCSKSTYPSFSCPSSYVVGTVCKEGCTNGDVRLVGGGFDNEGTVEVCYNNLWGLISDAGWNDADAKVVCRKLGHADGIFTPVLGSKYGKPNKAILFSDVSCFGDEDDLNQCTKVSVSLAAGKKLLNITNVAGVDCLFDEPTPPPCIVNPTIDPTDACTEPGTFRWIDKNGSPATKEGRIEHCHSNLFWTPLCMMDGRTAGVACKQFGFNQYSLGAVVESGEYGMLLNYSLIQNVTCTGQEASLSACTVYTPQDDCLPWCPMANIGVRCFDEGKCTEGDVRLQDAIIDQEGRVEVCVSGNWGAVCDDDWDKTDAHVVCQQLGYPEEEPVVFSGSYFGDGQFPIVYSNMDCGGWEDSLSNCGKSMYSDFTCPRSKVAGVLCGYDCNNGDVRLVGSTYKYEGYVEICYDNLWGLIENVDWTVVDAQVVCRQLGYQVEGTLSTYTKGGDATEKTVHATKVSCMGDENYLSQCNQTTFSIRDGREKRQMEGLQLAGVTCYTPDGCVAPPSDVGSDCTPGDIRLSGDNAANGAGTVEYCYKGRWSGMCSLGPREATVACRQLGYNDYGAVSIFTDGRYSTGVSNMSLFTNFSCGGDNAQLRLDQCDIVDSCQSKCAYPISIGCSTSANCNEGDVRLKGGSISQEGRVEVCHDNVWGSICGQGFDLTDAYVVCKELRFGVSEPVVYTNSKFGDGDIPVVYSNMQCAGYESSVLNCDKDVYASFSCPRNNIVGIKCQDNCMEDSIRLLNSVTGTSDGNTGTLQVCKYQSWGMVSSVGWEDIDTSFACKELGYDTGSSYFDGRYGKPNISVHFTEVDCNSNNNNFTSCDKQLLSVEAGKLAAATASVVGLSCMTDEETGRQNAQQAQTTGLQAGIGIVAVGLILSVIVILSLVVYVLVLRRSKHSHLQSSGKVTMSSLQDTRSIGVTNPAAVGFPSGEDDEVDDEKAMIGNALYDDVPRA